MMIREIEPVDVVTFQTYCKDLDQKTRQLIFVKGEQTTIEELKEAISELKRSKRSMIFVAYDEKQSELIGYLTINGNHLISIQHRASMSITVREAFRNQGIGRGLIQHAISWCEVKGINRLEVTAMATNRPAMALLHKMGFQIEGLRRQSIYVDPHYINEFYMSKIVDKVVG